MWGLVKNDFVGKDQRGKKIKYQWQNNIHEFNEGLWQQCINKFRKVHYVIGNGDIIDGKNPNGIAHVLTDDVVEQSKMAANGYFREFSNATKIFITGGTPYHSGYDHTAEEEICDMIGSNAFFFDELIEDIAGIRVFANHHSAHTKNKAASIETKMRELMGAKDYYGDVKLMVVSHNHKACTVQFGGMTGVMTPGWQHKTPYAVGRNLITPSDLGWIVINVTDENDIIVDNSAIIPVPNLDQ